MTVTRVLVCVATVASLIVLPAKAFAQAAQSGLSGVVKDTTGAVLPGRDRRGAEPRADREGARGHTDSGGLYRIVDLRPGIYTVTFSLPGFNTVRVENFELRADFNATVNADMSVGELAETITVTGEAPLVDVQSTTTKRRLRQGSHRDPAEQPADPEPRADDSGRRRRPEHRRPGVAQPVGARQPHRRNQQRHRRHVGSARIGGRPGGHLLHERRERPGGQRPHRRRRCRSAVLGRLDERDSEGRRQRVQLERSSALYRRTRTWPASNLSQTSTSTRG